MKNKTFNDIEENKFHQKITSELKEFETKINQMLMDFKIKYREDASYDIELTMPCEQSKNDRIKLTPTFRVRGKFILEKNSQHDINSTFKRKIVSDDGIPAELKIEMETGIANEITQKKLSDVPTEIQLEIILVIAEMTSLKLFSVKKEIYLQEIIDKCKNKNESLKEEDIILVSELFPYPQISD